MPCPYKGKKEETRAWRLALLLGKERGQMPFSHA
jgi:hypothetical protein